MADRPSADVKSPGLISGIYKKVSLSLGGSKDERRSKRSERAVGDGSEDPETKNEGTTTPTETPTPSRKPRADSDTTVEPELKHPSRLGHARSISQQVDVDSLAKEHRDTRSPALSEHTDDSRSSCDSPFKEGTVSKWTNYVTGWQTRWLVLKNGTLAYYRSRNEDSVCRGTVDLSIAFIQKHEFDNSRLDIQFVDQTYYLRVPSASERDAWYESISQSQSMDSAGIYKSHSVASLTSMSSLTSIGSGSIRISAFSEKLNEVKTYQTLVNNLVEKLQGVFSSLDNEDVVDTTKIKSQVLAEFLMLKSTTAGMLSALEDVADMAQRREDEWRKKLKKSNDKRGKIEAAFKELQQVKYKTGVMVGPDMQEGPHSLLTEEAWFDALDSAEEINNAKTVEALVESTTSTNDEEGDDKSEDPEVKATKYDSMLKENLKEFEASRLGVDGVWEIVAEDDGMIISRSQAIMGDATIDKNKTEAIFQGLTAKEICNYFSLPEVKTDWESQTIKCTPVENVASRNAMVCHFTYQRIWPSAPRDGLIINQMIRLDKDQWCAHGSTVEHESRPIRPGCIRIIAKCALFATTVVKEGTGPPTRDNVSAKIAYFAQINPGGWAPSNVVAAVSRREFPKTLRNLAKHALIYHKDKPLDFGV
eukprot:m.22868 g.22868  ORF g.22868 m.22868 type:complete len:647 (+) comp13987_c0_seq2:396-2336(+)